MAERIAVCVCTFRRPQGLLETLKGLDALTFAGEAPQVEVIVVDNDPNRSAEAACLEAATRSRWPLRYVCEEVPGIPAARNRCLDAAAGMDYLAFIDDDEYPEPHWLDALLGTLKTTGADIVAGPVLPNYEAAPPSWLRQGRFHDLPRWKTGGEPSFCATGNVLFRMDAVVDGVRFDNELMHSGGSDVLFFEQLRQRGKRITWCDEATVHERVPASRMTAKWVLRRAFRVGTSSTIVEGKLAGRRKAALRRTVIGLAHVGLNAAVLPLAPLVAVRDISWPIRRLQKVCVGCGNLFGALGFHYLEYRR